MGVLASYPWIADKFELEKEQDQSRFITALCPLHKGYSLRFWLGLDGNLMFGCYSGCTTEGSSVGKLEILRAVGATWKMCYPGDQNWKQVKQTITARYPYFDEQKVLLYETIRLEPGRGGKDKDFRQRRPLGKGNWKWDLEGVRRVLYKLPELVDPESAHRTVFVVAGEKDADNLGRIGVLATTNVCGERSPWEDEYSRLLADRNVVVIEDNDAPGRRHANEAAGSLLDAGVRSLRRCVLPQKDSTAFLNSLRMSGVTDPNHLRQALALAVGEAKKWRAT